MCVSEGYSAYIGISVHWTASRSMNNPIQFYLAYHQSSPTFHLYDKMTTWTQSRIYAISNFDIGLRLDLMAELDKVSPPGVPLGGAITEVFIAPASTGTDPEAALHPSPCPFSRGCQRLIRAYCLVSVPGVDFCACEIECALQKKKPYNIWPDKCFNWANGRSGTPLV